MLKKFFPLLNVYSRRWLSIKQSTGYDEAKYEKILMKPFEYISKAPGKHFDFWSPAINYWLQIPEEKVQVISQAFMDWIKWTILFDDIYDDSALRYGVPAAHSVYGVGPTINAGNILLLQLQKQIASLGDPLGLLLFIKRTEEFLHGQGIDLYWRDHHIHPSEQKHIEMTAKKVGSAFAFPVDVMQLYSENGTVYSEHAIKVGIYYELLDDYYNLFQPKGLERFATVVQENHTSCSDITDGKITLAVIHASQFPDVATELADIYKKRTKDPKLKNRAISLLKKHGSDEYVRDKLKKLEDEIRAEIEMFGGNPLLSAFMDNLSFHCQERKQAQKLYS